MPHPLRPATVLPVYAFLFNSSPPLGLSPFVSWSRQPILFLCSSSFSSFWSTVALSPGEKRRKHNIITISKSRFLMSSRGHNVPSPRSFVCHSRCFSRRTVHPLLCSDEVGEKRLTGKLLLAFPFAASVCVHDRLRCS